MPISQPQFAKDVLRIIYELSRMIYGSHTEEDIERIFGANKEQIENVVNRTVNALPKQIFDQTNKSKINELEHILAKEFIFFQVQEKVDDAQYQNDLANFILLFSRDINKQLGTEGAQ